MLEDGFYWVSLNGVWRIARYEQLSVWGGDKFTICGVNSWFSEHDFDEIDERRIVREG